MAANHNLKHDDAETGKPRPLYIFIDESGNFDFSRSGTPYLVLTAVSCFRPFWWYPACCSLRYDLLEINHGDEFEYFHASNDNVPVRMSLFDLIEKNNHKLRVDSIVVEKRKTHPKVQSDSRFYPEHLSSLISYVIRGWGFNLVFPETIVFTDTIPVAKKRRAVEAAIKAVLKATLGGVSYRIHHHQSRSHVGLQVADYCCWAISRKWSMNDDTYRNKVQRSIKSEFEIYKNGTTYYY